MKEPGYGFKRGHHWGWGTVRSVECLPICVRPCVPTLALYKSGMRFMLIILALRR